MVVRGGKSCQTPMSTPLYISIVQNYWKCGMQFIYSIIDCYYFTIVTKKEINSNCSNNRCKMMHWCIFEYDLIQLINILICFSLGKHPRKQKRTQILQKYKRNLKYIQLLLHVQRCDDGLFGLFVIIIPPMMVIRQFIYLKRIKHPISKSIAFFIEVDTYKVCNCQSTKNFWRK